MRIFSTKSRVFCKTRRFAFFMESTRPIVIAGPSGVGKSTNISRLMKEFPGKYGFSVSHTTRLPRPGETDGVQYHFVTVDKFKQEVENGCFIEWAVYAGNYYGTTVDALHAVGAKGQIALLDIDLQGTLKSLPKERIDPFFVMLMPPSIEELQKRIEGRGDTSPASIRKRIEFAKVEIEHARIPGFFDRVIVSRPGDLDATYAEFKDAILASQRKEGANGPAGEGKNNDERKSGAKD